MASFPDYRTGSPIPSSGRASPANPRLRPKDEDASSKKDKVVRRWAATVERVLVTFDQSVDEWADYISFLSRLLKSPPPNADNIPCPLLVAKRLAQCLSPALPSGVHQKALEVYAYIFSFLGQDGLSEDIGLYLPGLAPLVSFASLSVKPLVLEIYEKYLIDLSPNAIRPALKALILSLLPVLEEENSDEFDRALGILASFKAKSAQSERRSSSPANSSLDQYFWQCLFLASTTNPGRRPGALSYLTRNLPQLGPQRTSGSKKTRSSDSETEDLLATAVAAVAHPDPGLLVRCFCSGLMDDNVLVQRGFLDLLVERLPLRSTVLQQRAAEGDLKRLIMAATTVVLRRDMSLNRRLWAWFLGPSAAVEKDQDPKSPVPDSDTSKPASTAEERFHQVTYFADNGLQMLVQGLNDQLNAEPLNPANTTRTLRVCLALMDRFEIGNSLISHVFVPALSSVQSFQLSSGSKASKGEVLRGGSAFFDSVESGVIWHEIVHLIDAAFDCTDDAAALKNLELVIFMLSKFNVREEDMQLIHLPLVSLFLICKLNSVLKDPKSLTAKSGLITSYLRLLVIALQQFPARAVAGSESEVPPTDQYGEGALVAANIKTFYLKANPSSSRVFPEQVTGALLLDGMYTCMDLVLVHYELLPRSAVENAVSALDLTVRRVPWHSSAPALEPLISRMRETMSHVSNHDDDKFRNPDIALTLTLTSIMEILHANSNTSGQRATTLQRFVVSALADQAWHALSPSRPQNHVEASRCLWRLQSITTGDDIVESTIVSLGAIKQSCDDDIAANLEHIHRFTVFWQQSQGQSEMTRNRRTSIGRVQNTLTTGKLQLLGRPLFQVLDRLLDPDNDIALLVVHWLEDLPDLALIINVVLAHMDKAISPLVTVESKEDQVSEQMTEVEVDLDACIYYVRLLEKVIYLASSSLHKTLQQESPEESKVQLAMRIHFIVDSCVKIQTTLHQTSKPEAKAMLNLRQASLILLERAVQFLSAESIVTLKLDLVLLDELYKAVTSDDQLLQIALTKASVEVLKRRFEAHKLLNEIAIRNEEADTAKGIRRPSISKEKVDAAIHERQFAVPSKVLDCILAAFSGNASRSILDCWFDFLKEALQLYGSNIFQVILPLNECCCNVLRNMALELKTMFSSSSEGATYVDEAAIAQVLNALERPLEIAHGTLQELLVQENGPKTEQQAASFFGMVSVLAPEGGKVKTSADNNRLTVLLCFKDALRVCFEIWSIDESTIPGINDDSTRLASFKYTMLRLRNRTRRIVEHLFQARDVECVEALVALWHDRMMEGDASGCNKILALLSTVDTARPKVTIPALFNGIYSRTHPAALDPDKRSSLTSDVTEVTLAAFCINYLRSLEDDATDEIWQSCLTFLKDVLTSPLNHRQILVLLLEFAVTLSLKIDKTNFGEQRKMRRDLGDLFIRLLSAITTIRPPGANSEQKQPLANGASAAKGNEWYRQLVANGSAELMYTLASIFPRLTESLLERDRIPSVTTAVSTQILGPTLRSKTFPENVDQATLELLRAAGQVTEASKTYKKDVYDAFNDPRFFSNDFTLVPEGWLPVLRQWAVGDKDRIPELLSRLTPPAAAGLMFGVGASSARLEADRKTQLTLRRVCALLLAGPQDAFVINLPETFTKIGELLNATTASSPSSVTRAEVYMVSRALLLRISPNHLNAFWPVINSEISDALSSTMPSSSQDSLNSESLLQLCKLIDTLLLLNLDEFQLQEWLFVTDTTDALYRPAHLEPVALTDLLAESLDADPNGLSAAHLEANTSDGHSRKPLLDRKYLRTVKRAEYKDRVFRPFFRQLSIASFEASYSMSVPDTQACVDDLLADLFDDTTLV